TAVDSEEKARAIAQGLLEERLAGCVQLLGPLESRYWWKGKIEAAREWLCLIKARAADYDRIEALIKELHPYEVPEILAFPVAAGNPDYLEWLKRETDRPMKEPYFTTETIAQRAREMLELVRPLRERHPLEFRPERAALLVLDMQRYFLEEGSHAYIPSARAILPKIEELIVAFAKRGRPVILTRHINTKEDAGQMAKWWRELIQKENRLSELIPELSLTPTHSLPHRGGEWLIIEKGQYDAFYKTPLEELLRGKGVEQLAISGVMTHLCCETTARSAFVRGFEVLFVVDGTATYNAAFHRASLLNLAHGFAYPLLAEELLALLEREKDD
ncbi:MAG: divalent cation tolerance protein CutA, partial [Candidatus Bipolaricaulia bacterium]